MTKLEIEKKLGSFFRVPNIRYKDELSEKLIKEHGNPDKCHPDWDWYPRVGAIIDLAEKLAIKQGWKPETTVDEMFIKMIHFDKHLQDTIETLKEKYQCIILVDMIKMTEKLLQPRDIFVENISDQVSAILLANQIKDHQQLCQQDPIVGTILDDMKKNGSLFIELLPPGYWGNQTGTSKGKSKKRPVVYDWDRLYFLNQLVLTSGGQWISVTTLTGKRRKYYGAKIPVKGGNGKELAVVDSIESGNATYLFDAQDPDWINEAVKTKREVIEGCHPSFIGVIEHDKFGADNVDWKREINVILEDKNFSHGRLRDYLRKKALAKLP